MAVDATIGYQSEKMEPMSTRLRESFLGDLVSFEFALRNRLVDPGEVLINDSAGAEIQMAHFGIAHLAFGQPDINSARAQFTAWIIAIEAIVKRRLRQQGGVAILFALPTTVRI